MEDFRETNNPKPILRSDNTATTEGKSSWGRNETILLIIIILLISIFISLLPRSTVKEVKISSENQKIIEKPKLITLGNISGLIFDKNPLAEKKQINILFLGIPGETYNAPELTDTIILINIRPKTQRTIFLSIPRDLLVKIPPGLSPGNLCTKINALYTYKNLPTAQRIEAVKIVINEITGIVPDYWVVLDLEGVKKIIDQVGGINVLVKEDVYDPAFPGPNNSYQIFQLKKGWRWLDGETALKYIRTRHDPGGDFARISRQQEVLMALKNKVLSLNPFWNFPTLLKIWNTLSNHLQTNLALAEAKYFWELGKEINPDKIIPRVIDNNPETGLLMSSQTMLGNSPAYVLMPQAGKDNYGEIKKFVSNLFGN